MKPQIDPLCEMSPTSPARPSARRIICLKVELFCAWREHAHAIGAAQAMSASRHKSTHLALEPRAILVAFGKSTVMDHRRTAAGLRQ